MIKLLTSLTRQPAENCIILTYNADLLFFEYMVFDPLYAAGCRNMLVMCDPAQYQLALRDTSQLRHAGQRYPILPARTSPAGAFHPKLILFTSSDSGRVFLTSGNLTKAGYTANWEVASLFEYTIKKPDLTSLLVCQWAFDTLSTIASGSDNSGLARKSLDQLWSTTAWLRRERPVGKAVSVWPLHNIIRPLFEQVLEQYRQDDGSPVREAIVVSPFFDTGAAAIDRLLADTQPHQLTILTQGRPPGLNPLALKAVLARHATPSQIIDLTLASRRLHAKALVLRTERGVWVASGSANFTAPAWLRRAEQGNTEMVVLRYETNPVHFDHWLNELVNESQPLNLDWEFLPTSESPSGPTEGVSLTLLGASVEGHFLVLRLTESLPPHSNLTLHLDSMEAREIGAEQWSQTNQNTVRVALTQEVLARLERPRLVALEVTTPTRNRLCSNPMLVHHIRALSRASQPLRRRDRPRIPEGMEPESYEHCAQILDMLTDLLASNTEQLNRHRGRTVALVREERLARDMELEEGYNPEDHFVAERVQVAATFSGGDLYVDYDDRLTYEELLRAVLAAVYQPLSSIDQTAHHSTESGSSYSLSERRSLPTEPELRLQMLGRIERGFQRLIANFERGTNDLEYMASIPPRYLTELFVILLTFLRATRQHEMLSDRSFAEFSWNLLAAFWGDIGQPGAWQNLRDRVTNVDVNGEDTRLALSAQTWFHAAMVAEVLSQMKERRIYDFAGWMRQMRVTFRGPEVLVDLATGAYQRLWQTSYSSERALQSASDTVMQLQKRAQAYDNDSLCAEVTTWPGAHAVTSLGTIAGLRHIPKLDVRMPLDEEELDRCLQTFILFLQCPQPKGCAWARFTNTNPMTSTDDLESVTIFYRNDDHLFSLGAKRASGVLHPDVEKPLTRAVLSTVQCVAEL